jgi:hypothetical protein
MVMWNRWVLLPIFMFLIYICKACTMLKKKSDSWSFLSLSLKRVAYYRPEAEKKILCQGFLPPASGYQMVTAEWAEFPLVFPPPATKQALRGFKPKPVGYMVGGFTSPQTSLGHTSFQLNQSPSQGLWGLGPYPLKEKERPQSKRVYTRKLFLAPELKCTWYVDQSNVPKLMTMPVFPAVNRHVCRLLNSTPRLAGGALITTLPFLIYRYKWILCILDHGHLPWTACSEFSSPKGPIYPNLSYAAWGFLTGLTEPRTTR